ncbi:tryptophan-rich sensory protein [Pseudohoeflea suaedae]|uniref:Tryptophan-rich sensory protein n=1 Tax=Pseudohoeflea suaedae TaxID=877384 RepID=A0A4R5PMW6_9HYPH|nr:TspO/MBR family protein [Pseudohoeflea suaedae]TDH37891.1 tryptophan-rich sensory protein [Pseudohoeflea suaedae]
MRIKALIAFLLLTVGGGLLIGSVSTPDQWYQHLAKPAFNPPSWVFAPVWTILYVMIAVAGARVWSKDLETPVRLWFIQMILNFLWSPVFFVAHKPGWAIIVIVLMFCAIVSFIVSSWNRDRVASLLFLPYAVWVAFAAYLNIMIQQLNG